MIMPLFDFGPSYRIVKDGDAAARALMNRHYSRGNKNSAQFCASGQNLVLLGIHGDWVFIWRNAKYRRDNQTGIECFAFRNESPRQSSEIILECEGAATSHFGAQRMFTYVNPNRIRSSNPGYCFQRAGWELTPHISTKGLRLLVKEHPQTHEVRR